MLTTLMTRDIALIQVSIRFMPYSNALDLPEPAHGHSQGLGVRMTIRKLLQNSILSMTPQLQWRSISRIWGQQSLPEG
jgi:hypothetical protein